VEIKARAKINLSLDVLGKREDGYHELRMVMQTVSLHDSVYLEKIPSGIELVCTNGQIPQDDGNIAWKAAGLMTERYRLKSGVSIKIEKRIPVSAGLAGGSADAAAVLRGVNLLLSLGLDNDSLRELGKRLGADVPYCIEGGTRLAEGTGEILTALPDFGGVDIVLVKPRIDVSTAWVYGNFDTGKVGDSERPDTELIRRVVGPHDLKAVATAMRNVLEKVTVPEYPIVKEAKDRLLEEGAWGSMMSGSGPTVFGIFPDAAAAAEAFGRLSADGRWQCFLTKTE
jgi:4-diphosphocytidyl-2-C-methyl-D-erythritol kinase